MRRGTTPTLIFDLPFDASQLAEAWISIAQGGKIIVDKTLADCELDGCSISTRLTQAETLALSSSTRTEVQLRVRTILGEALASEIFSDDAERILKDGEI